MYLRNVGTVLYRIPNCRLRVQYYFSPIEKNPIKTYVGITTPNNVPLHTYGTLLKQLLGIVYVTNTVQLEFLRDNLNKWTYRTSARVRVGSDQRWIPRAFWCGSGSIFQFCADPDCNAGLDQAPWNFEQYKILFEKLARIRIRNRIRRHPDSQNDADPDPQGWQWTWRQGCGSGPFSAGSGSGSSKSEI